MNRPYNDRLFLILSKIDDPLDQCFPCPGRNGRENSYFMKRANFYNEDLGHEPNVEAGTLGSLFILNSK